jgi:hypothetical protein
MCNWATLLLGKLNAELGPPDGGNLKFETTKSGHEFRGILTRKRRRWRGPAAAVNYRPALSSGREPHNITNQQMSEKKKQKEKRNKNWSRVPDGGRLPGQTGRPIVSRKITLTST